MKLILLGTGTSTGIPEVGCNCMLCRSHDPKDKRLRTSALLISDSGTRILIDCGPDFRQQANQIGLDYIDAIVLTHEHYDHVYGLDDLRTIAWSKEIPIYGQPHVLEAVRRRMHYVFSDNPYPGTPKLKLCPLQENDTLVIKDVTIKPITVMHGKLPIFGYRFLQEGRKEGDDISYITDMKTAASCEIDKIDNSAVLIINALRYRKEHPSHQSVEDVIRLLNSLKHKPKQTILTHLSHHAPSHTELTERLAPHGICPGYDYACISSALGKVSIRDYQPALPIEYSNDTQCNNQVCISVKECDESSVDITISYPKALLREPKSSLNSEINMALAKLAQFQRISSDEMQSCIYNEDTSSHQSHIEQKISLSINSNTLCPHSIQTYCGNSEALDTIVIKHLLSAFLYKELKAIMADIHLGSLHPTNH